MVTISIKDQRTGSSQAYTVGYFNWDAWHDSGGVPHPEMKSASNPDGACANSRSAYMNANYSSLTDAEKGAFRVDAFDDLSHDIAVADFLDDMIRPDGTLFKSSGQPTTGTYSHILDITNKTMFKNMFIPSISSEPSIYHAGEPDYNPFGLMWKQGDSYGTPRVIDGYYVPTQMEYTGGVVADETPYYTSSTAERKFQTVNGMYFGLSVGVNINKYAIVSVFSKQIDCVNSANWQEIYNTGWAPQNGNGEAVCDWSTALPLHLAASREQQYSDVDFGDICPFDNVTAQFVITKRDDIYYMGVAAIKWRTNDAGIKVPAEIGVWFMPQWMFGGVSGDFDPMEPIVPDEIPDLNPEWRDGTWTIPNSRAGTASGPQVSPLANVGVDDAGLHLYVVKQSAMTQLTDKAWTSNDSQLASLTSGVISCGFLPQVFIDQAIRGHSAVDHFRVGTTTVDGLSNSAWLINDQLWVTKLGIASFDLSNRIFENYLDFEPYTSVTLTVPFCGEISIPASMCIGGSITVDMTCNMTNGDIVATVTCVSGDQSVDGFYNTVAPINNIYMRGNCLAKFPVAGMSNGMNQFMSSGMQLVGGILNTAGNIATGNFAGAITGGMQMAQGVYGISNAKNQPVVNGAPIGSVSLIDNKKCFITIKTVAPAESNEFDAYHPYFMHKWVQSLSLYSEHADDGYYINGKWNLFTVTDICLEDDAITAAEQELIKSLLREGVLI